MTEPSYDEMHRLNITDWKDAPEEYNYWGAGDPMEINKGDLEHMMKGYLLNYSDDGEYGHYLKLSKDAIDWLRELNHVSH
ncbi:hypothetical protein [Limosilactobacillus vaginalis]